MKIIIISLIFVFNALLLFANSVCAQIKTPALPIINSWNFIFETDRGVWFESPIEITVKDNHQVIAAISSKTWIKFSAGKINGNEIILTGESQYGGVKIVAKIAGDVILGQWQIGSQKGNLRGKRINFTPDKTVSPARIFDFVQSILDKQFYDPGFNGVDWKATSQRYRQLSLRAKSDAELIILIRNMLGELGTSHLEFYRENAVSPKTVSKKTTDVADQSNDNSAANLPVTWKELSSEIGYLQIRRFEEGQNAVELVDKAFAEIGNLNSLIIDLRGNEGGTLSIGMRLCDYLFNEMRPLGVLATRKGLDRLRVKSIGEIRSADLPVYTEYNVAGFLEKLQKSGIVMLKTGGRATHPFRGRLVVLINERSGSATEAFAGVIKESGIATLIGRRTAGAMLSSTKVDVPGGWTLLFPEANFVTAGGMTIEGKGVEPHIVLLSEKSEEAILKRAVEFLKTN